MEHYQCNISAELKAKVDALKDMVMLREDSEQHIFTNDEIVTVCSVYYLSLIHI